MICKYCGSVIEGNICPKCKTPVILRERSDELDRLMQREEPVHSMISAPGPVEEKGYKQGFDEGLKEGLKTGYANGYRDGREQKIRPLNLLRRFKEGKYAIPALSIICAALVIAVVLIVLLGGPKGKEDPDSHLPRIETQADPGNAAEQVTVPKTKPGSYFVPSQGLF